MDLKCIGPIVSIQVIVNAGIDGPPRVASRRGRQLLHTPNLLKRLVVLADFEGMRIRRGSELELRSGRHAQGGGDPTLLPRFSLGARVARDFSFPLLRCEMV